MMAIARNPLKLSKQSFSPRIMALLALTLMVAFIKLEAATLASSGDFIWLTYIAQQDFGTIFKFSFPAPLVVMHTLINLWDWLTASQGPHITMAHVSAGQLPADIAGLVSVLKAPYLVADLTTGVLIYFTVSRQLAGRPEKNKLASIAYLGWLLNPYNTISAEIICNIDAIATLCLVAGVYALALGRNKSSALSIAIGGAFKLFPLFLLPVLVMSIFRRQGWRRATTYMALTLGFFILSIVPFVLATQGTFLRTIFVPEVRTVAQTEVNYTMFYFVGGGEIPIFYGWPPLYLSVILGVLYVFELSKRQDSSEWAVVEWVYGMLLIFFGLCLWTPHWLLWISPFVMIDTAAWRRSWVWAVLFFSSAFSFMIMTWPVFFFYGGKTLFFFPAQNDWMRSASIWIIALKDVGTNLCSQCSVQPVQFLVNVARSIFAGVCSVYLLGMILRHPHRFKP